MTDVVITLRCIGSSLKMSLTFELTMSLDCLRKGDVFPHLEFGTRS